MVDRWPIADRPADVPMSDLLTNDAVGPVADMNQQKQLLSRVSPQLSQRPKRTKLKRSYGIACCRFSEADARYEILMVRKRVSYGFVTFVLGGYSKNDDAGIIDLLNNMTIQEKIDIMSLRFDVIWWRMWLTFPGQLPESGNDTDSWLSIYFKRTIWDFVRTPPPKTKQELYIVRKAFFEGVFLCDGGERLRRLMSRSTKSVDQLWEIPKGGIEPGESFLQCAQREFREETNVSAHKYSILGGVDPVARTFTCNETTYSENYFVAMETEMIQPKISVAESMQLLEIDAVAWVSIAELRHLHHNDIIPLVTTIFKIVRAQSKHVKRVQDLRLYICDHRSD